MKKQFLLLSLLAFHTASYAQSKWSAGYRLGLVHQDAFSNNSNKASNVSNQVFLTYRILKRLELEAGLQHNQTRYKTGVTDEMVKIQPYPSFSNFKAQIFTLSLNAKYHFFNQGRVSIYALAGWSSCMLTGYYETRTGSKTGEITKQRNSIATQFKPLASLFAGFGAHYQLCPKVKLNAQVAMQAANIAFKVDSDYLQYLYNPNLTTQIGFLYSL